MRLKFISSLCALAAALTITFQAEAAYQVSNGTVVMEAENATTVDATDSWGLATSFAGYVGSGYRFCGPNNATTTTAFGAGAKMQWSVNVTSSATYYIAVRLRVDVANGGDDSFLFGVDNVSKGSESGVNHVEWKWERCASNLGTLAVGTRTIELHQREDGLCVDRIMIADALTKLPADGSTENGPAESSQEGGCTGVSITTNPANQTVSPGSQATFTVVAAGTTPITYQWKKNGTNISGATSASYSVTAQTADNGALYSCYVTNCSAANSATSTAATLTVSSTCTAVSITTQPSNLTVAAGSQASFTVVAAGTTPITYQWKKNGTNISGATSASYTFTAQSTDNNALFSCYLTNCSAANNVTSTAATLTIGTAPATLNKDKLAISADLYQSGTAFTGTINTVTVKLIDQVTSGTTRYTETFSSVAADNGALVVRLGEGTTSNNLKTTLSTYGNLWVEFTVKLTSSSTAETLTPRMPLTGAAYLAQ